VGVRVRDLHVGILQVLMSVAIPEELTKKYHEIQLVIIYHRVLLDLG
jgi:hypothetical protein